MWTNICWAKICLLLSFTTAIFLFSPSSGSCAGPPLVIDPEKQFEYAEKLFRSGDYPEAVGEYKRFVHFFPDHELAEQAQFQIGMSYFKNRGYGKAVKAFTDLIDTYRGTDLSFQSYIRISRCHLMLNAPAPAILALHNLISLSPDTDIRDEAFYRLGWIYIETGDWQKAGSTFKKISSTNRLKFDLEAITDDLARRDVLISNKNPALAGFLSLVPGVGYLYCERKKDALIAFAANGILAYAAYESFDHDLDALGGIISFIGFGFYAGNIYGATTSAHKYNQSRTTQFIDRMKKKVRIDLYSDVKPGRVMLSLRYRF